MEAKPVASERQGWYRAFTDLPREHGFEPLRIEGELPADLTGTLYRNGPSQFAAFERPYRHWFDGDGAVSAVRFGGGQAAGSVRLVQSQGLQAERRAGRALYGIYGTTAPSLWHRLGGRGKNVANTSLVVWNDRLFALYEGGLPTELSPEDLTTIGESDLDGVVTGTFSAHPHTVRSRQTTYNIGMRYGRETTLEVYALPHGGQARRLVSLPLPGATMLHDFITTDRHLIVFVSPLRCNPLKLLLGLGSFSDNLVWQPDLGTEVILIPLDAPDQAVRFTTDPFYQWHFANAFEQAGRIVVDLVHYPDFGTNRWLGNLLTGDPGATAQGRFARATIDPAARTLAITTLLDRSCEFPRIATGRNGQDYRYAYLAAHSSPAAARTGLFDSVVRLDVETGATVDVPLSPGQFPSEPVLVTRTGASDPDDGYLLSLVYDAQAHASHVAVIDTRRLTDGPLARVWFDHHLPFTFHGGWAPQAP